MNIEQIFKNNRQWLKLKLKSNSSYFKKLAKGQNPDILYIGCSDSRVTAEEIMGVSQGDVLVHRNIANMVPNNDLSSMSVINYAVVHIKVSHIVVCGHYNCEGVNAAMQSHDLGLLNPWVQNIRDVYSLHKNELNRIDNPNDRHKRLVELNVQEQCFNVNKSTDVRQAINERSLKIHSWVFDIETGKLLDLENGF